MARGRGGRTVPAEPAPVSGPGALARRTDGGPTQPIRAPSGGPHGQRKALEDAQRAAPLPAAGGVPATASPPPSPAAIPGNVFDPGEMAGIGSVGPGPIQAQPGDPYAALRVMYRMYPHPDIARLLGDVP